MRRQTKLIKSILRQHVLAARVPAEEEATRAANIDDAARIAATASRRVIRVQLILDPSR